MAKKFSTTISLGKMSTGRSYARGRSSLSSKSNNHFSLGKTIGSPSGGNRTGASANRGTGGGARGTLGKSSFRASLSKKLTPARRKKITKIAYTFGAFLAIFLFVGLIGGLVYMQEITKDLPDPERPFDNENFQTEASIMYDRNGKELYRLFSDDNRDILRIPDGEVLNDVVPPQLKWAFLSAEDIDFYSHPGFNVTGILRCSLSFLSSGAANCGGSTITQQIVKLAALEDNTRSAERKIKELVLALQLENKVKDKDKILLLYMNIAPQGGNMYGVKIAAKNYFNKDIKDLTLAEAVTIASIPVNPSLYSPTRGSDIEANRERLDARRKGVLQNMLTYKDKVNEDVRKQRQAKAEKEGRELTEEEKKDFVTEEDIKAAQEQEMEYKISTENIIAPHFVFFARDLLTKRPYNNGEAFTLQQINTGGYKIYTTLDNDLNNTALDVVQNVGYGRYGKTYGSNNAAMMTMIPKTGEILTMVGSRCYDNREQANCSEEAKKVGRTFDPQVNVLIRQRQPGSSIKPMVYYEAIRQGKISPGSSMADIPIDFPGNYKPKNSDGKFIGINTARHMLATSRNIPANVALFSYGPDKLAEVKQSMGYSVNIDPATYGVAAALGAQDVLGVEHATAFATLANGGKYVPYEAIMKIVDKEGKTIYELGNPDLDYHEEPKQVLDEKAVFLVNDMTNPRSKDGNDSPVKWRDGRDIAGKTGTSENNRDNWFVMYTPDFVTLNWAGNNDNTRMKNGAFGSTNAEPWAKAFMERVAGAKYFTAKTPFTRPGGISKGKICSKIKIGNVEKEACENSDDYYITGLTPPAYQTKQTATVCKDQTDRLARDIDKVTGNAEEREFTYMKMPDDRLQSFLDKYLQGKQGRNGAPTEECNVSRSPNGANPWAIINNPQNNGNITGSFNVGIDGLSPNGSVTRLEISLGTRLLRTVETSSFSGQLDVPADMLSGSYDFIVKVTDSAGKVGTSSVRVNVSGVTISLNITDPAAGATLLPGTNVEVKVSHSGQLTAMNLLVTPPGGGSAVVYGMTAGAGNTFTYNWSVPLAAPGSYSLRARGTAPTTVDSSAITVTVGP